MNDIFDQDEEKVYPSMAEYFAGKTVAITGGTGFLGKATIEKLLRCCPEVKKIILFIREKKDVNPHDRLKEVINSTAFDRLRKINPDFGKKLLFVSCQLDGKKLGLDNHSIKMLTKEVNVFIHSAATLNFKEHLRLAYDLNTKCVRRLMKLCKQMKNLQSFVYVSTAYSNCNRECIKEQFYETEIDYMDLESSLRWMDDETITKITPDILGKRPNSYTLTKALGEDVIKMESGFLPVCIVRPSMIIPALSEPMPGWCCNVYGPTASIIGYRKGIFRSVYGNPSQVADLIPVDFVVNAVLAAAMKTGCDFLGPRKVSGYESDSDCSDSGFSLSSSTEASSIKSDESNEYLAMTRLKQLSTNSDIPIYHINSGTSNKLLIKEIELYSRFWGSKYPFSPLRAPSAFVTNNRWIHNWTTFVTLTIPCYIVDAMRTLLNKRPKYIKLDSIVKTRTGVMDFFFTNGFIFGNENINKLRASLNPKDAKAFNMDVRNFNWVEYFKIYIIGIQKYILNEDATDYTKQHRAIKQLTYIDNGLSDCAKLGVVGALSTLGVTDFLLRTSSCLIESAFDMARSISS